MAFENYDTTIYLERSPIRLVPLDVHETATDGWVLQEGALEVHNVHRRIELERSPIRTVYPT